MNGIVRNIPHVRQSDRNRNCGAACICMLLHAYGKKGRLKDVTSEISVQLTSGLPSCRNNRMIQFIQRKGIDCCGVSAKNIREIIPFCLNIGLDIIISYRPALNSPRGHFSVVTGFDNDRIFVNDPERDSPEGMNFPILYDDLELMAKADLRGNEIVRDNTMLLLASKTLKMPRTENSSSVNGMSCYVFTQVQNKISAFIDPYPDDGVWRPC